MPYITNHKSAKKYFLLGSDSESTVSQAPTHVCSDSGADRTYHARDTAGRARTGIRVEILKNTMFGPTQFSVYTFARSIKETPFRFEPLLACFFPS